MLCALLCFAEVMNAPSADSAALVVGQRGRVVMSTLPMVVPFLARAAFFSEFVGSLRGRSSYEKTKVHIRREYFLEDAMDQVLALRRDPQALQRKFNVTFMNELGVHEAGIDSGGPYREFLEELGKRTFDPQFGFWKLTEAGALYPNPDPLVPLGDVERYFEFSGIVLGKLLLEGALVGPLCARVPMRCAFAPVISLGCVWWPALLQTEAHFAGFFLSKVLGKPVLVDDLWSLDAELFRHLLSLKSYEGDFADLNLCFAVRTGILASL